MTDNPFQDGDRGIAEILKTAFYLFRENFSFFMTFSVFYGFLSLIDNWLLNTFLNKNQPLAFFLALTALAKSIPTIAIIQMGLQAYRDKKLSLNRALEMVRERYWPFVLVNLLTAVVALGGFFLFVLPGIYFWAMFFFAEILIITEGADVRAAFQKSADMAKARFWEVLGFSILLEVLLIIPLLILAKIESFNAGLALGLSIITVVVFVPYKYLVKIGLFLWIKKFIQGPFGEDSFPG